MATAKLAKSVNDMAITSLDALSEQTCLETIAQLDQASGPEADQGSEIALAIDTLAQACVPQVSTPATASNCALLARMGGLAPLSALLFNGKTSHGQ